MNLQQLSAYLYEVMSGLVPIRLVGLDPLHWTHVKLFIREIKSLGESEEIKGWWTNLIIQLTWPTVYIGAVESRDLSSDQIKASQAKCTPVSLPYGDTVQKWNDPKPSEN